MFGRTRQSWYYKQKEEENQLEEYLKVYALVLAIREHLPKIGGRKLYFIIKQSDDSIQIGRDKFFTLLREWGLLIKKRRQGKITTFSHHWLRKYPNLVKDMRINSVNQVWVSDITYIHVNSDFLYLSLVTDAYSKKIIGYSVFPTLEAKGPLIALRLALKQKGKSHTTHHSDRGIQYCSKEYIKLLKDNFIRISMADKGNPYQNAIAERVNGILKNELGCSQVFKTPNQASIHISEAVKKYNCIRPHMSCNYLTPNQKHEPINIDPWNEILKNVKKYKDNQSL